MQIELIEQSDNVMLPLGITGGTKECSEEELVARAKDGSHAAFEKLVRRYEVRVFRLAQRIARSHEDAEDVIQQSFQKAFVHLHRFEGRSSFSTWLTRIVLNEALMLTRSGRRFRGISIDHASATDDSALPLEIADSRPNPEHTYFQQERCRLLFSAIDELRPGIRVALQNCDLNELSIRETARILGVSVAAVKSRVNRGRKVLREKLKQRGDTGTTHGKGIGIFQAAQGKRKLQFAS